MELKILEHCCYTKYLNNWWEEERKLMEEWDMFIAHPSLSKPSRFPSDAWTLVHYGDHNMTELVSWCCNVCSSANQKAVITAACPMLTPSSVHELERMNAEVTLITAKETCGCVTAKNIIVPDMHMNLVAVSGNNKFFVLSGGLIQQYIPGKYITSLLIGKEHYSQIKKQLDSLIRVYSHKLNDQRT